MCIKFLFDQVEEKINELEDRSTAIIQSEGHKAKGRTVSETCRTPSRVPLTHNESPEGNEEKEVKRLLEEIMAKTLQREETMIDWG